jgi:hypothetical protein
VFKNNDIAQVREVTDTELVLHDGRRMRCNGARIDQGICITSHASQCRTVDQVVVLADGADAKGRYVSLSRARDAMHVYTRNKPALRQSVMRPGDRKSLWEFVQAIDAKTHFEIGSITKQFTAAAILQLKEQEKLPLDDVLAKYVPTFPHSREISIRQLLNFVVQINRGSDLVDSFYPPISLRN